MHITKFVLLLGLGAATACHHAPVASAPEPVEDLAARARADSIAAARRAYADSVAMAQRAEAERQAQAEAARLARLRAALRDTLGRRTFFDFDRADIRPDAAGVLDRKLAILRANPMLVLRIAGHADERGSDEYNLALGARRAAAARDYLVNHGIAPDRLETVSFGEERPLVVGHDESAWSMNRRDEYDPVRGADSLAIPIASR